MSQIVSGHFTGSSDQCNVICGFVPDYVEMLLTAGGTELVFRWYKALYDNAAAAKGKYGFVDDGAGVLTHAAAAANGIIPYDPGSAPMVFLPAPNGNGEVKVALAADFVAGATQPTARTVSVPGTTVRPSTHNGFVYECTATAGVYGTEPTWGTTIGGTTSDGTNTWTCRPEKVTAGGGMGFTIGVDVAITDGDTCAFRAEKHDRIVNYGDADDKGNVLTM